MRYVVVFRGFPDTHQRQAAVRMGLPDQNTQNLEDLEKRFSDDILRIEFSSPEHHHLSVVDVPGLFHSKKSAYLGFNSY